MDDSILAAAGSSVAWIFAPLGWGGWRSAVAALTGLVAKENIVGIFGILFGFAEVAEDGAEVWGALTTLFTWMLFRKQKDAENMTYKLGEAAA